MMWHKDHSSSLAQHLQQLLFCRDNNCISCNKSIYSSTDMNTSFIYWKITMSLDLRRYYFFVIIKHCSITPKTNWKNEAESPVKDCREPSASEMPLCVYSLLTTHNKRHVKQPQCISAIVERDNFLKFQVTWLTNSINLLSDWRTGNVLHRWTNKWMGMNLPRFLKNL